MRLTATALAALSLAACGQQTNPQGAASAPASRQFSLFPQPQGPAAQPAQAAPAQRASAPVMAADGRIVLINAPAAAAAASTDPQAAAIEQAALPGAEPAPAAVPAAPPAEAPMVRAPAAEDAARPAAARAGAVRPDRNLLIRAQVLLDRAHFTPGVIDGRTGSNLRNAISAFQTARSLPVTGELDAATFQALTAVDATPVTQDYVITAEDVAGPFHAIPADMAGQARLERLGYASPREALAERFHMDERLLAALNPAADFARVGTRLTVVRPNTAALPEGVERIEVDKNQNQLRVFGADGRLLAAFPATVGSTGRPAPSGEVTVRTVAPNPTYTYDPTRMTWGDREGGRLTLAAGPNNPVGSTWIDLSRDTYGIHGTPDPTRIGKTASHGCVRLTNWDAALLGRAVRAGMTVVFVGAETRAG